jgi:type VI secretion system secreted protein VgrG
MPSAPPEALLPRVRCRFVGQKPCPPAEWRVRNVDVREPLGRPYEADVELVADDSEVDVEALVGTMATLILERGSVARPFNGVIERAVHLGVVSRQLYCRVRLVPVVALLRHEVRSRVFQHQNVPDIIEAVVGELLLNTRRVVRSQLHRTHLPREYCVQYDESTLDFVQRLLAEEGMAYFFEQSETSETLVLTDDNAAFGAATIWAGDCSTIGLCPVRQADAREETVARFDRARALRPATVVENRWEWFVDPAASNTVTARYPNPRNPLERLSVVQRHNQRRANPEVDDISDIAYQRLASLRCDQTVVEGIGDVLHFAAGRWFDIDGNPEASFDGRYLLTEVRHVAQSPDAALANGDEELEIGYENRFSCIPLSTPFRLSMARKRSRVLGPQTAVVVGPDKHEIHTDSLGRIKVRMHWDLEAEHDDSASCWVRVAQTWAGPGHGSVMIPRVGSEVVIAFLDGNPDRPLCIGCLYNQQNKPVYDLPGNKTQSGIKTRSSPRKDGFNELRFEDAAGQEEIYIHAEKDFTQVIGNCKTTTIENNETVTIKNDRTETIEGQQATTIRKDRVDTVEQNATETIWGSQFVHIRGRSGCGDVVGGARLQIDGEYCIEVRDRVVIRCGETSLELTPTQATITAPRLVHIKGNAAELELGENADLRSSNAVLARVGTAGLTVGAQAAELCAYETSVRSDRCTIEGAQEVNIAGCTVDVYGVAQTRIEGGKGVAELSKGLVQLNP